MSYRLSIWVLFGLFVLMSSIAFHRVPGLMGDEASEGENVYQILNSDSIVVTGERSYIGPLIDYIRVPFIALFGYTTVGVRLPMLLFMLVTFYFAAYSLRHFLGDEASLYAMAFMFFSPIWMTHQRLSWAITLFPFFVFLITALSIRAFKQSPLLAGLAAGLGLSNHIIFLPSLAGLAIALGVRGLFVWRRIFSYWPAIVGFWAGFGMQLAVLLLWREDQGNIAAATGIVGDRWRDLPSAWQTYVTGSSYVAHYTGIEFTPAVIGFISIALVALVATSLLGVRRRPMIGLLWVWMVVYLPLLLYVIDRFSLRYFVMGSLWVWMMAGLGLYELIVLFQLGYGRFVSSRKSSKVAGSWLQVVPIVVAVCLSLWVVVIVFIPYWQTGGSTNTFSLGNRRDSASALVDVRPLVECLAGRGPVFSENVHIFNRLLFVSHSDHRLQVVLEDDKKDAAILVDYVLPKDVGLSRSGELCPELAHFRVVPASTK